MKRRLLDLIACRECGRDFMLEVTEEDAAGEIVSGALTCPGCQVRYPILGGIPRFIPGMRSGEDTRKVYADSFGHQWTTYNWLRDEDGFEFHQITDLTDDDLAGKVVFDAGCGGGRFTRIVAPHCKEIVGLDYSIAVERAHKLCAQYPHAHFIQCDINRHPLKAASFDLVYSHGVLHHTPDTKTAFDNLPRLVRPGGQLYVALFRQAFLPLRISDQAWRSLLNKLPIRVMDKVCGALSYLSYLPAPVFWKRFFWFSLQRTHELRKCCLYDWYAPRYHHEHTVEEVMAWFRAAGFPHPKYINAWPYCPPQQKYAIPTFKDSFRLGQLLGVIAVRGGATARAAAR
jgi:SAM-dependent methyltransferase